MDDLASQSFWLGLDIYTPSGPLTRDLNVDVALVGGGFTSLWAAYFLLREHPGLDVAVLEGNEIGFGASGRNAGIVMTRVHRSLAHLTAQVGDGEALNIYRAARRAVEDITDTVRTESIPCDLQANGLLVLSTTPTQDRRLHDEIEAIQRLGLEKDFEFLDRDAARDRIHSEKLRCGFREDAVSLINPARLARGLKRLLQLRGARVYEGTPVRSWDERSDTVVLHTPGGTVTAGRALVAGNAYGTAWAPTRASFLPFYSYICVTRPLSDAEWERVGWAGREGAVDKRVGLHYFRPTSDGRILWGGRDPAFRPDGPKAAHDRDEHVFGRLRESFEQFFPQLRNVPFEYSWGGPIAITGDHLPAVGWFNKTRRRVAFAYGYNGDGIACSNLAAHAVADTFAGRESEWTELCFVGRRAPAMGPSIIRDRVVRRALERQISADDEGRDSQPPRSQRALARILGRHPRLR